MSSDQPRRGRESTGSPLGSTAAIIIAIVAVVAGFLILRQINDDDNGSDTDITDITSATDDTTETDETTPEDGSVSETTPLSIVTTIPALDTTTSTVFTTKGAIVVVANASTVNGAAGQLTTALTGQQFDLVAATNSTVKLDVSKIYYDPANAQAQAVATTLATLMAITDVAVLEQPAPVEGGTLQGGATVLVMLGSDKAGKTLDQMSAPAGTETTVAGETTTSAAG
jgi:hypothetical protein